MSLCPCHVFNQYVKLAIQMTTQFNPVSWYLLSIYTGSEMQKSFQKNMDLQCNNTSDLHSWSSSFFFPFCIFLFFLIDICWILTKILVLLIIIQIFPTIHLYLCFSLKSSRRLRDETLFTWICIVSSSSHDTKNNFGRFTMTNIVNVFVIDFRPEWFFLNCTWTCFFF